MPPRDANILHMLNEIDSLAKGLTKWEEEFVIDLRNKVTREARLTDFQYRRLCQIYEERVR